MNYFELTFQISHIAPAQSTFLSVKLPIYTLLKVKCNTKVYRRKKSIGCDDS